jgi:diguanylate cyclase (GGDEF)-like protein/PAS domain S-box-containing protein
VACWTGKLPSTAPNGRAIKFPLLSSLAAIRGILAPSGGAPDQNFWTIFIDAQGIGVTSSNNLPVQGISYADRPYFKAHLGPKDRGLYVDGPEIGRVSTRPLFFLSRRVVSSAGKLIGVVVAPIDAGVFARVFKNALFQPSLSITVIHTDGKVIAREPRFKESFAAVITETEFYRHVKISPNGSYEHKSRIDGQQRIYSFQTIDHLPLALSVGIASEAWTDGIKEDLTAAGIAFAVILAVMIFSSRFALRSFRSLENSEADQKRLNQDLRFLQDDLLRGEKRLRMIADSLPALVSYIDAEERYVFHNSYYRYVFGTELPAMLGRTMREMFGDRMYFSIKAEVTAALNGKRMSFERAMSVHGIERHLKFQYTPDFDIGGKVIGFYTMVTDITDMKLIQAQLVQMTRVDNLTGLPNRNQLYERLGEALTRARRCGLQVGCLYLDIDNFKSINDTLGHAGGDEVLRQFGARLQGSVREADLVARLAGDEFVIVLEGIDETDEARRTAEKIIHAMRYPFEIEGHLRMVTTSVGVATSDDGDDPDALLKKADGALYLTKRAGKNGFELHLPSAR